MSTRHGEIGNGRYRLMHRLGSGGSGVVYGAIDTVLGRPVALKALHSAHGDVLRMEAQALARLTHPNIVAVYDLVPGPDHPYLVLEYVEGCDLQSWLQQHGAVSAESALTIVRAVADAMAAAHAHGILHCDLKPANILISTTGEIKLTDFTLAQCGGVAAAQGATQAYASPEQLAGEELDERADIFGLGAVLHRLLTAIDPQTPLHASLSRVAAVAMAPSKVQRYPSVRALLAALPAVDDATRIIAPPPVNEPTRIAPRPPVQSSRRIFWLLPLVATGAIALGAGLFVSHLTASASPPLVTVPNLLALRAPEARSVTHSLGLQIRLAREYNSVAAGTVIEQRPAAAVHVIDGATVHLIVSRGPRPVSVPALTGLPRDAALAALRARGLTARIQTQDTVFSATGRILDQAPGSGATLPPHGTVTITVSTHPWWWIF